MTTVELFAILTIAVKLAKIMYLFFYILHSSGSLHKMINSEISCKRSYAIIILTFHFLIAVVFLNKFLVQYTKFEMFYNFYYFNNFFFRAGPTCG